MLYDVLDVFDKDLFLIFISIAFEFFLFWNDNIDNAAKYFDIADVLLFSNLVLF